jgi:hypothetical protein
MNCKTEDPKAINEKGRKSPKEHSKSSFGTPKIRVKKSN